MFPPTYWPGNLASSPGPFAFKWMMRSASSRNNRLVLSLSLFFLNFNEIFACLLLQNFRRDYSTPKVEFVQLVPLFKNWKLPWNSKREIGANFYANDFSFQNRFENSKISADSVQTRKPFLRIRFFCIFSRQVFRKRLILQTSILASNNVIGHWVNVYHPNHENEI